MKTVMVLPDETVTADLFVDPERETDPGPYFVVVDDFFPDPYAVRKAALDSDFVLFSPPTAEQVGEEIAAANRDPDATWVATSLLRFEGVPVNFPQPSPHEIPDDVTKRLGEVVGAKILKDEVGTVGDGWHGAFHSITNPEWPTRPSRGAVHHHYKEGDLPGRGWSGIAYLSPDAPPSAGTSLWKSHATGKCVAAYGIRFTHDYSRFSHVLTVENKFNRLVLFRENVLHRVEHGFGSTLEDGRLTQSYSFLIE